MFFKKAQPVWANGREKELNLSLKFTSGKLLSGIYKLAVTASCLYRAQLNGEFLGYGPARCAHGFFRVDEYEITVCENARIQIEVAGYNTKSFYTLNQPSFLQAEITDANGEVIYATGETGHFECYETQRLSRVVRLSYQRPFTEYYSYKKDIEKQVISRVAGGKLLQRGVDYPNYKNVKADIVESGTFTENPLKATMETNRINSTPSLKIYDKENLERCPVKKINSLEYSPLGFCKNEIRAGEYSVYKLDVCQTGFVGLEVNVKDQTELHVIFDEIDYKEKSEQSGIFVDYRRNDCYNVISYELLPGEHNLLSFEAYTSGYIKIIVISGNLEIKSVYVKGYQHPFLDGYKFECKDKKIEKVVMAAARSFAHNAVDALTDCPSRERAAWLCDGLYSARAERFFTGENKVEKNFLENYLLYRGVENIPEGMLPMCYPADFEKQEFIPNWAMWYVLQLKDYFLRTGDKELVALSKKNIDGLIKYFSRFENQDGLLENLENWVFVEWSKANEFTFGVNYPTNMLYAKMLDCIAELYGDTALKDKAENIREIIRKQSFNGEFFIDNAVRMNGKLESTINTTETCQYYAFYFEVATRKTHGKLFDLLVEKFGPARDSKKVYPTVYPSNTFMGDYMRLDILSKENYHQLVLSEAVDYFYKMAVRTGTLWEHDRVTTSTASLDHGFASYVACLISKALEKMQDK